MSSRNAGRLSDHWQCFEGIIPSPVATASRDGTPNIGYLSQVFYIDERHVALSNQFMSKTVRNVLENPRLQTVVTNAVTGLQIVLDLMFERVETTGPVLDQLAAQVSAVAEHHGMGHVMKLRSADIYRVLDYTVQDLEEYETADVPPATPNLLADAIGVSLELSQIEDLEQAIQLVLDKLENAFGFDHCMVLLADTENRTLTTIGSRGYDRQGAGAEVPWGQGIIGIAAEKVRNMRFAAVARHLRYANNVATTGLLSRDMERIIPLPGLENSQSVMAIPMIAGGEVRGVVYAESVERIAFSPIHEKAVALVAAQLGSVVALAETSRELEAVLANAASNAEPKSDVGSEIMVNCYAYDDSLFINNEYVIKGVPGRLLWRMLQIHAAEGRSVFTNREFRLDASLKLPEFKDNLETRILLLSRRLDEKEFPVRIHRTGRGQISLSVDGELVLSWETSS